MGANDGFGGIAREVLAEAGDRSRAATGDQAEQLELVPAPTRFGGERAERIQRISVDARRARGAGRPKGAQNLATRQVREYIRAVFGDPMEESARWLLHTPETLASELGCTLVEAFDRLETIRRDLRPYFYAKLAPTDQEGRPVVPVFALQIGDRIIGMGDRPPWLEDPEVARAIEEDKRKQALSETAANVSHGESRTQDASD